MAGAPAAPGGGDRGLLGRMGSVGQGGATSGQAPTWGEAIKEAIKTPEFLGHAMSGVGKAVGGMSQAGAMKDATQAEQDRWDQIAKSYEGLDTATPMGSEGVSFVSGGLSERSEGVSRQPGSEGLSARMGRVRPIEPPEEEPPAGPLLPPMRPEPFGGLERRRRVGGA